MVKYYFLPLFRTNSARLFMELKKIITQEEIRQFCLATQDYNVIHDADFMHTNGKRIIAPGMLVFCLILSKQFYEGGFQPDTMKVIFNSIVSEGESLRLYTEDCPDAPDCTFISAFNGRDSFSFKNERSRIFRRTEDIEFIKSGWIRELTFHREQIRSFDEVIQSPDKRLSNIMFSIAYASNALLLNIDNPRDEIELEIKTMLDKNIQKDPVSAFYQSLDIYLDNLEVDLNENSPLEYKIQMERLIANRTYLAHVQCSHSNKLIYHSVYKLSAIPDRLIMRMAPGLSANLQT